MAGGRSKERPDDRKRQGRALFHRKPQGSRNRGGWAEEAKHVWRARHAVPLLLHGGILIAGWGHL